ncbi:MAG: hypothetical protein AB7E66_16310 [Parvibaculaceae bacterium]
MYERLSERPISRPMFIRRLAGHFAVTVGIVLVSLAIGVAGYMVFEGHSWDHAFLSAAMLLGGLGMVDTPSAPATKVFAGLYALYSGLVFVIMAGIVLAPALHRLLHKLHWDDDRSKAR